MSSLYTSAEAVARGRACVHPEFLNRVRPFTLLVGGETYTADGSLGCVEQLVDNLPLALHNRMLRLGVRPTCWVHAITDMFFSKNLPLRLDLELVETESEGYLHRLGERGAGHERSFLWCHDLDLIVSWGYRNQHAVTAFPCVEFADEFFRAALPEQACAWWLHHGGTPLTFYLVVHGFSIEAEEAIAVVQIAYTGGDTVAIGNVRRTVAQWNAAVADEAKAVVERQAVLHA